MKIIFALSCVLLSGCYADKMLVLEDKIRSLEKQNYQLRVEQNNALFLGFGPSVVLEHISFTSKGLRILPSSYVQLDDLARQLVEKRSVVVRLICHTDDLGSPRYNYRLSMRRLEVLKDYLIENGVHDEQVEMMGQGEFWPISSSETWDGRHENRRIEAQFGLK
jgi:outer membrane protein OmpA-like peptidoglycan-associated protein